MSRQKLWGGRFTKATNQAVDDFHSSIRFDQRLYYYDIQGSMAHATMLGKQNIIPPADAELIVEALKAILTDIEADKVTFDISAEDIHMNVEQLLIEKVGDVGKKLHTGRSRNDQVALDTRMFVKTMCESMITVLTTQCETLVDLSQQHLETIMPGYTHLQKAQPVTLAFHLMAYFEMFKRDITRFQHCMKEADVMPLGSGALAGTTYPLDRDFVADQLGFTHISPNAMDAVSDRDYVIDFIHACAMTMMHLSRLCEEIILWSTDEYRFIELDDSYSTGSSIMPQKKNPDVAELIRGKTGRVYGHLMGLLTTMKGLPLAYNKDMQEDKEALFDSCNTAMACVNMMNAMLSTATFSQERMAQSAAGGFTNATDVADYLAKKGIPFRKAHEIVGKLVLHCIENDMALDQLTLEEYQTINPEFEEDIFDAIDIMNCIRKRNIVGGPAPEAVQEHIRKAKVFDRK